MLEDQQQADSSPGQALGHSQLLLVKIDGLSESLFFYPTIFGVNRLHRTLVLIIIVVIIRI